MLTALLAGVAAGLGIAVPVGAIAVLILDLGARRGFLPAFAAGSGAATADLLYASACRPEPGRSTPASWDSRC